MRLLELLSEVQRPEWLSNIDSLEQAIEIAAQHATELGRGASRVAYKLPNNRVLKLATTQGGLDSNATEIQMLSNATVKQYGVTIPLVDSSDDSKWLITEFARPATEQLFQKITGGSLSDLINYATDATVPNDDIFADPEPVPTSTDSSLEWVQNFKTFCQRVRHITPIGELSDIKNWGEYRGKPVIIDLGATYIVHRGLFADAMQQL